MPPLHSFGEVAAMLAATAACLSAYIGFLTRRHVAQVSVTVNGQRDAMLERIDELERKLGLPAGAKIPQRPITTGESQPAET